MSDETVSVSGIHLVTEGADIVVRAEVDGRWVEVIRELNDGPISHIVEPGGIKDGKVPHHNADGTIKHWCAPSYCPDLHGGKQ